MPLSTSLEKERQTEDNAQPRHHVYVAHYYSSVRARVTYLPRALLLEHSLLERTSITQGIVVQI